ncbi:MAG: peptidase [Woeseia sp.]|nr:peptidase [Woeseia sp.]MBT8096808.1 peptidase [Woeseia sp.]NNE60373.1 peptidase [Woeseia sp.]NNL53787.1 peptidase [Woeseia sp.]
MSILPVTSARFARSLCLCCTLLFTACGGGGGGGGTVTGGSGGGTGGGGGGGGANGNSWQPGVFLSADTFKSQCVNPRSGINPATGQPYADVSGTRTDENNFLRSYSNDTYLWYDEITDRDPALFETPEYFDLLVTEELSPSGRPKDRPSTHFTYPTDEYFQLSQSGVTAGYGLQWALLAASPPRKLLVAYTEPNTPATDEGLLRGAEILEIDGVDVAFGSDVDTLNAGLFPAELGETHTFRVRDPDGTEREISMTSQEITSSPVQNVQAIDTPTGKVGYMQFNSFGIRSAEQQLIDAITELRNENIEDLVIDLRYNGGGFIFIASELSYMIAGANATGGRTFEKSTFNDKYPTTNPVTGQPLTPTPFFSTSDSGQALPALDLARLFVLTGPGTCSASESVINGLRGIDIEVIQIGSTTCGKPYGFYATDNCGTTYFTIQLQTENDAGFGDYADGFSPQNAAEPTVAVPGCQVADDFTRQLGDPLEGRFAAALAYRDGQGCPAPSSVTFPGVSKPDAPEYQDEDMILPRSPLHEMRIMDRSR